MSKFSLFLLAACAAVAMGMKGGMLLTKKFDYFVYFLTSENIFKGMANNTNTVSNADTKWLYCMGVLYDLFTVVTADLCKVEADGVHWAAGVNSELGQIHYVKSVVPGRHPLDFRVVQVKNSSVEKWGPLGETDPLLMIALNEDQLKKEAGQKTKGIVASFSKPPKLGAMMMLSLDECEKKYVGLLKKFPTNTASLAVSLPRSVFCAVQATEPFDPNLQPKRRFRRGDPTNGTQLAPEGGSTPVDSGPVTPGTACPDSLGSPFIVSGGRVLGILVAADCHTENIAFFQSLVDHLPTPENFNLDELGKHRTFWPPPSVPITRSWTPRGPMVKGATLKPVGWKGAGTVAVTVLTPFGVANGFAPSMFLISVGLTYALWATYN